MTRATRATEQIQATGITTGTSSISPTESSASQIGPNASRARSEGATAQVSEADMDRLAAALAVLLMEWWRKREQDRTAAARDGRECGGPLT